MSSDTKQLLKFFPFSSVIDIGFWHLLANKKLISLKLDDQPFEIIGHFRNDLSPNLRPLLNVDYDYFQPNSESTKEMHKVLGQLIVTNTFEDFLNRDKKQLINDLGKQIWQKIIDGTAVEDISQSLSRFLMIVYADLKKYKFHYWFAFPAICFPQKAHLSNGSPKILANFWTQNNMNRLYSEIIDKLDYKTKSYFLVLVTDSEVTVHSIEDYSNLKENSNSNIYFAFSDSSSSEQYPGWPLRNYLCLICYKFQLNKCSVLAIRLREKSVKNSLLIDIEFDSSPVPDIEAIECVGWEKNENNKLMPRIVDLGAVLDPIRLSENAVDLNLMLMRWRLVPSLDLETIVATRCLILGSGTLGCYVARGLMAWGIRNITFVDNSQVSYSNPVRQPLFKFEDCIDGGKDKSLAAAEALKQIFPNMNSKGIQLSIPMPGHPVSDQMVEKVKKDVQTLSQLIDENDVIFLLMDTRESRWLPTVLSAAKNKIVINAALGFDSFLVQRHGIRNVCQTAQLLTDAVGGDVPNKSSSTSNSNNARFRKVFGSELGCYFCSDVVAPGNSTKDRTLDQQCTVTRPGISMLASALAVELMVSVLQHPMRGEAPALVVNSDECDDADTETALGIVPHQIRGFLSRFQQLLPTGERFDKCSACSDPVINEYNENGFEFLLKAFNDSEYVSELTGLTQLHNETNLDDVWVLTDSDDDHSDQSVV